MPSRSTSRSRSAWRSAVLGSPGPLEKNTPSGAIARISSMVVVAGSTCTSMPRCAIIVGVIALMPRSTAATVKRLSPTAGTT